MDEMSSANNLIHEYKCVIAVLQSIVRLRRLIITMEPRLKPRVTVVLRSRSLPINAWPHWCQSPALSVLLIDLLKELKISLNSFWKIEQCIKYLRVKMHTTTGSIHHNHLLRVSRKRYVCNTVEVYSVVKKTKIIKLAGKMDRNNYFQWGNLGPQWQMPHGLPCVWILAIEFFFYFLVIGLSLSLTAGKGQKDRKKLL